MNQTFNFGGAGSGRLSETGVADAGRYDESREQSAIITTGRSSYFFGSACCIGRLCPAHSNNKSSFDDIFNLVTVNS